MTDTETAHAKIREIGTMTPLIAQPESYSERAPTVAPHIKIEAFVKESSGEKF